MSASLTQDMAATALGVGRSTVAMWEAGRAVPRTDKLQAMARLYRCTVDELLRDEPQGTRLRVPGHREAMSIAEERRSDVPQELAAPPGGNDGFRRHKNRAPAAIPGRKSHANERP